MMGWYFLDLLEIEGALMARPHWRDGAFTCVGWQVTLCDPIRQVMPHTFCYFFLAFIVFVCCPWRNKDVYTLRWHVQESYIVQLFNFNCLDNGDINSALYFNLNEFFWTLYDNSGGLNHPLSISTVHCLICTYLSPWTLYFFIFIFVFILLIYLFRPTCSAIVIAFY